MQFWSAAAAFQRMARGRLTNVRFGSKADIEPLVLMAVKDAVKVEHVGEFILKGIGRPLAAYNVLGVICV